MRAAAAVALPLAAAAGPGNATNTPSCGVADGFAGEVINVTDGVYARCVSVVRPAQPPAGPLPVLFFFHGSGGNARECGSFHGSSELGELAAARGFAVVCGEALQDAAAALYGKHGQWQIPEVITDETGTPCDAGAGSEAAYIANALAALTRGGYDTARVFFSGCSMGSGFSGYISQCVKRASPGAVSAFATHSTGLKVKGDGLGWPDDIYHPEYNFGECPGCQYFPMKPANWTDQLGLKACIFDNAGDFAFYNSSINLARAWAAAGNRAEAHFSDGGHCAIHSYASIVNCLDDGTGRLLAGGPVPGTPAPLPAPKTPAPPRVWPPSDACVQCYSQACPGMQHANSSACDSCIKHQRKPCEAPCDNSLPFGKFLRWFCAAA